MGAGRGGKSGEASHMTDEMETETPTFGPNLGNTPSGFARKRLVKVGDNDPVKPTLLLTATAHEDARETAPAETTPQKVQDSKRQRKTGSDTDVTDNSILAGSLEECRQDQ